MKRMFFRLSALATFGLAVLDPSTSVASDHRIRYGAFCQREYQNDWLKERTGAYEGCRDFLDNLSSLGTEAFYRDLDGRLGPRELHDDRDDKIEKLDILYVSSHMGAWHSQGATIAPFEDPNNPGHERNYADMAGLSKRMRLGEEEEDGDRGLSILALHGCGTLALLPGDAGVRDPGTGSEMDQEVAEGVWPRWKPAMRGGLRMIVGSWDVLKIHRQEVVGRNFGKYLREGKSISEAWVDAAFDADSSNEPAVLATGRDEDDCYRRLDDMTIRDFHTKRRLRDDGVKKWCLRRFWRD